MAWYHTNSCSCPVGDCCCFMDTPEYKEEQRVKADKKRLDEMPVPEGKVVFLGSNPSCTSPYEDPFSHCKSANKMLNEWIPALGLTRDQVHFMNVANYKTQGNRPLKWREVQVELGRLARLTCLQNVVTLGKTAAMAMEAIVSASYVMSTPCPRIVINMPHPSGRNRLLNDKDWVQQMLVENKQKLQKVMEK